MCSTDIQGLSSEELKTNGIKEKRYYLVSVFYNKNT